MSGQREPPLTTAPEQTAMENATTSSGLGFRLLSQVEGRNWLSTIRRNTPKLTSASGEHPSPQTPIGDFDPQSQLISITTVDSPTTQQKTIMITDNDNLPEEETIQGMCNVVDHIHTHGLENDNKQQEERSITKEILDGVNHNEEEIKVTEQLDDQFDEDEQKKNAKGKKDSKLDEESSDADKNDKMMMIMDVVMSDFTNDVNSCREEAMQCVYDTLDVHVNDPTHRVQNNDEKLLKEKNHDDTNHVQKHQGTGDVDPLESIIEEDEDEQKENAEGKKDSKLDEESCIEKGNRGKATNCDVDKNEKMMTMDAAMPHSTNDENNPREDVIHCEYNTLNVPVSDHIHREQNNDEQQQKEKEYDDLNHIQESQGTKDTDQRENIIEECENGDKFINQFGEDGNNKKIHLDSGKTSGSGSDPNIKNAEGKKVGTLGNAPRYPKSFECYYDNVTWKNKHRFGSRSKKTKKADKLEPKKREFFARHMVMDEIGTSWKVQSNMCHQCQRNDKGRVVRCRTCTNKRYCYPCMSTWYPNMTEEMFAEHCPVCLGICNCKPCLRDVQPWLKKKSDFKTNNGQKVECSKNILQMILPFLKDLNEEHLSEMEIEAEIKGCSILEVKLKKVDCPPDCLIYCNCCKTTILDLHRRCPRCEYDLCLTCCRELRDGQLQGHKKAVTTRVTDPGPSYLHGELQNTFSKTNAAEPAPKVKEIPEWKPLKNGSIRCPPRSLGGCRLGILELMHILPLNRIPTLLEKANEVLKSQKLLESMPKMGDSSNENDGGNKHLCKASSRENSNDNYLFCPSALDIESEGLKHFQCHWAKGEPVMVSNVLELTGLWLSWEPMVMCRSFRQTTNINHGKLLNTKVVNCLDWRTVDISFNNFFKWYTEGRYDDNGWPQILKLTDHPPSERHAVEFISCLPFKEYTHPHDGNLNLATQLHVKSLMSDVGPKTHISYGFGQELGRGDSVTKLHFNIFDVVNVLTHTATVTLDPKKLKDICRLKRKHTAQDQLESFGGEKMGEKVPTLDDVITDSEGLDLADGGALWDIFRRKDTPKLELYLRKHFKEFRHVFCLPLQQVIHPIHDQTFYLTMDHKRRLKEEFGIEPWTIVQKLGDAVFVPAGCAHQVRNLKSCTNVTLDFISPESFSECVRLNEEIRLLPQNHRAKEDKLEDKKIALYVVEEAVRDLQHLLENDIEHRGYTDHLTRKKPPKAAATCTSSTTAGLPRKHVKNMVIIDGVNDNMPQEKPIQGKFDIQNKERSRTRSGSGHDPSNKKDNKNKGKTEATIKSKDRVVIDYDRAKQNTGGNLVKDTKDKTSSCDDDELLEVVNVSDDSDTNHIQEHQGTKITDQHENIIKECENRDNSTHQFGENGQNKKIKRASGCSEPFKYDYGNARKIKKRRYGSGYNVERNKADKLKPKKRTHFARRMCMDENGNLCNVQSNMCHQCQRNDKGRVVRCLTCDNKRYCVPCMTTWYPNMTEDMFAERCPVCCGNCNCKPCLRNVHPWVKNKIYLRPNDDQKVQGSKNILHTLLPFLKCLNEEHIREMETEAEIKGCSISEVKLKKADCKLERIYCDCCKTSILDLHRCCSRCKYDFCLACCRELRKGQLQGYKKEVISTINDPGQSYLHGGGINCVVATDAPDPEPKVKKIAEWKPLKNGSIRCPPRSLGGCSRGILELIHVWSLDEVPTLLEKAQKLLKSNELMEYMLKVSDDSVDENDGGNKHLCKASSREYSNDNYLYFPSAVDIESGGLNHFQCQWLKGEPVMVSNVLAMGLGLSWEPMVMFRSFRQVAHDNHDKHLDAKAINCLDWREVDISFHKFFKGYMEGRFDDNRWPQILKLKDSPPSDRHTVEFISSLPFKQYTHPDDGYLNLATKLPINCLKPDVGPKTQISYGFSQELGRGDSVTKLHFSKSDVVNVLTHTATVTLGPNQLEDINRLRRAHMAQDQMEFLGKGEKMANDVITNSEGLDMADGGALWDIFRREDTPKLELYLKKHFKEFRHVFCLPLQQVIHPIHDQTFYLNVDHKKRLKEEFGIEPWTFVQKLGDAVFVPVGCAHQVRNLKSCTNVTLNFVSPENFTKCLKLTEDRRLLPQYHPAKEDSLQVKKMALYAVEKAVNDLESLLFPQGSLDSHYDVTVKSKKQRRK